MKPTLRPFRPDDQEFLFKLYASTRLDEIAPFGWPAAQQEAFLRMQFMARQQWYEAMYAQAEHQIVELNGQTIGRLMVLQQADHSVLVDIALLAEHRRKGIGGELVRDVADDCRRRGVALRLQVLKSNPALRLYERLGFIRVAEDEMYIQMERAPA